MSKGYNIKVYDIIGNIITTITKPLSNFSFDNSINSGVNSITISTKEPTGSTRFDNASFVEIQEYSDVDKSSTPLFAGFVQAKPGEVTESRDVLGLECVGTYQLLSEVLFDSSGLSFNKNADISVIVSEIIALFNSKQQRSPPIQYQGFVGSSLLKVGSIPPVNIDINFDKDNCLQAIIKCFEGAGLDFYIQPDGTIVGKEKPAQANHRLTLKKDVQSLNIKSDDKQNLVNYLRLERSGGVVVVYQDIPSQTANGFREIYLSKTDINNATTQNQFGNKYISDNKDPKKEITIVVNNKYNIASIEPGDYVKVLNSDLGIDNLKILKTSYSGQLMTLNVDKYISLGQLLKN